MYDVNTCGVCHYEFIRVDEYPCKLCTRMWERGVEDFLTIDGKPLKPNKNAKEVILKGLVN